MKTLVVFMVVGLGFVLIHEDNQLDLLRNKVQSLERRGAVTPPVKDAPATDVKVQSRSHDEIVEHARSEAARRRKEYCDTHPNLTVRIGCD